MLTDIQIAQEAKMANIKDVAALLDITEDDLDKPVLDEEGVPTASGLGDKEEAAEGGNKRRRICRPGRFRFLEHGFWWRTVPAGTGREEGRGESGNY